MYTGVYSNRGSSAKFYKLKDKNRGFKEFDDEESAIIAHRNQTELAEYDLAPRVYSEVGRIRVKNNRLSRWGYITEIAATLGCGGNDCECCDRDELECEWSNEIADLCDQMESYGFNFSDCHSGNVGFVKRHGRMVMVCIDTGDESVQSENYCNCLLCRKGEDCRG